MNSSPNYLFKILFSKALLKLELNGKETQTFPLGYCTVQLFIPFIEVRTGFMFLCLSQTHFSIPCLFSERARS